MTFGTIGLLASKHQNEIAWLFGKGPSLESIDMNKVGPLRICINESLLHVANPTYFFAHDETPIRNCCKCWPNECIAILENERAKFARSCGVPQYKIHVYRKEPVGFFDLMTDVEGIKKTGALVGMTGTVHSAIHFCKLIGVSKARLVGFEGGGQYAARLNMEVPPGGGRHAQIRNDTIRLMQMAELEYEFLDKTNESSIAQPFSYDELYNRLRENDYHRSEDETSHIAQHLVWISENLDFQSVLDIGCSTGKSVELFAREGTSSTGVEVSTVAVTEARSLGRNVVQGCATSLPFADNSFDLVCSADVFEHLRPEDAEKACKEACRVAKRFVFLKIAEREDATERWKLIAGHPLHLTTQPIEWWKQWCKPFGEVIRMERELICLRMKSYERAKP